MSDSDLNETDPCDDEVCGYCGSDENLMGSMNSPNGVCCLACLLAWVA